MKAICLAAATVLSCLNLLAQGSSQPASDPFKPLAFLEGTWDANVQNNAAVKLTGRYAFTRELGGHVLARALLQSSGGRVKMG